MTEENGDTQTMTSSDALDKATAIDTDQQASLGSLTSDVTKPAHHNFHSMADLLRAQEHANDSMAMTSRKLDMTSSSLRQHEKNDENENIVQDLRLKAAAQAAAPTAGDDDASLSMRQDHLRRWYNGDLNATAADASSFNVDVDGESTHSDIPSDVTSDADNTEFNSSRREFNTSKSNDDEMTSGGDFHPNIRHNGLKHSSPSDVENLSETEQDSRKSKRKQYTPKQRDIMRVPDCLDPPSKVRKIAQYSLQEQLDLMARQLREMQNRVLSIGQCELDSHRIKSSNMFGQSSRGAFENKSKPMELNHSDVQPLDVKVNMSQSLDSKQSALKSTLQGSPVQGDTPKDLVDLARTLKTELTSQMGTMVDTIMQRYAQTLKTSPQQQHQQQKREDTTGKTASAHHQQAQPHANNSDVTRKEKEPIVIAPSRVSPVTPVTSSRPSLNLSPRTHHSEPLQRTNPCNNLLESMKHSFPFAYNNKLKQDADKASGEAKVEMPKPQKPFELNKKLMNPYFDPSRAFENFHRPAWFPHLPFYPPAQMPTHSAFPAAAFGAHLGLKDQEQTEALPLVVSSPKKKRTKVTDTRLSPRAARALLQEPVPAEQTVCLPPAISPLPPPHPHGERKEMPLPPSSFHSALVPASLPTSVAIPNPSLQHPDFFSLYARKTEHLFGRGSHDLSFLPSNRSPVRDDSPNTSYTPSDSPSMFKDSSSYSGGAGGDQDTTTHDGYTLISFHYNLEIFFYDIFTWASSVSV